MLRAENFFSAFAFDEAILVVDWGGFSFSVVVICLRTEAGLSHRRASSFLCATKRNQKARLPTAVRRNSLRACGAALKQPPEIRVFISKEGATLARAWAGGATFFNNVFCVSVMSVTDPLQSLTTDNLCL